MGLWKRVVITSNCISQNILWQNDEAIIFGKLIIAKAVWFYYDKNREKL